MSEGREPIVLYRGFPVENKYAWSAFVTKTEFRLRHAKLAYKIQEGSVQEGPNGKIPYIDISPLKHEVSQDDNQSRKELIADSTLMIKRLVHEGALPDLNANLAPEQKATDLAIRSMLEEKLYFLGMHERWLDNYYVHRDYILQKKPWLVRIFVGNMIHKKTLQTLHLQGCGRFTADERKAVQQEILQTLEDMVALKRRRSGSSSEPFWVLGGSDPTEADATLYAFINSNLVCESCPESTRFTKSLPSLMDYAVRIHDTYFPDYQKWQA